MARHSSIARASIVALLVAVLAACSAAPGASTLPASDVASASPSPTASPSPSSSEAVLPTDSPAPATSVKPRPSIDQADLAAMLTSSITLLNLADADLRVVVAWVDPDSVKATDLGTYALAFTEQQSSEVPPGVYRLEFGADSAASSTCTIELADGDAYTFAAIDGAVAVSRAGDAPTQARELFVATSSLCGK